MFQRVPRQTNEIDASWLSRSFGVDAIGFFVFLGQAADLCGPFLASTIADDPTRRFQGVLTIGADGLFGVTAPLRFRPVRTLIVNPRTAPIPPPIACPHKSRDVT
jgi:hypothetical protein